MSLCYLFGPVSTDYAAAYLRGERDAGRCLTFGWSGGQDLTLAPGDTWESVSQRLPEGWRPDFLALYLPYRRLTAWTWSAPVPLVGLAADWTLLWHHYRRLAACDLLLTDTAGVEAFLRQGLSQARPANLFGCDPALVESPWPDGARDLDIFFAGNLHSAVQRERLSWLGRVARLGRRWRVRIATGVFGADYRRLLGRSRIVFNRSARGECNMRAFEAAAAGALLFQEAENRELPGYFRAGQEYVSYTDENLEQRLEHYLSHEEERARLAAAAHERVREYTFPRLWDDLRA